jgi:molybdopterin-guanine dinucleotide biosynthesis protein A
MADQRTIVAVLAGGRGVRLGGAKPTAVLAGRPLIAHPLQAAGDAGLAAIVVAKARTPLPPLRAPILREDDEPSHPLCGVIAALRYAVARQHAAVLMLGCDMPFVTGPLLDWLAGLDGAAMAQVGGRAQPLLARVPVDAMASLERALAERLPLRRALNDLAPRILGEQELGRFGEPRRLCFNVNEPADLRTAADWLARAQA